MSDCRQERKEDHRHHSRSPHQHGFVRIYPEYGIKKTIVVYLYSNKDGAFSARGDSGAIVVDSKGQVVGLLVAGAGATEDRRHVPHSLMVDQSADEEGAP